MKQTRVILRIDGGSHYELWVKRPKKNMLAIDPPLFSSLFFFLSFPSSSVASPICQEGQSKRTFLISPFFPDLFSDFFRDFLPLFPDFWKIFRCQGGTLPPWPPMATPLFPSLSLLSPSSSSFLLFLFFPLLFLPDFFSPSGFSVWGQFAPCLPLLATPWSLGVPCNVCDYLLILFALLIIS